MKKKFLKATALVLVCGMLAGCGGKKPEADKGAESTDSADEQTQQEQSGEGETQSGEEETPTEAAETVNIKWYVYNGNDTPDKEEVEAAVNAYIEPLIGVTVTMITSAEEPELALALASGEDIDLYWTAHWSNGRTYIKDNSCLDLTDYLPEYPDLYQSIPENVWEAAKFDNRNYFVPVYKEAASGNSIAYSVDMAEEYGWDFSNVKTFEDLTPFLEDAKEKGATNAWLTSGASWVSYAMDTFSFMGTGKLGSVIGVRRDEKDTIINLVESEEYADYVSLMYQWNQAGYINKERVDSTELSNDEISERLAEKDIAFLNWSSTPDGEASATLRYGTPIAFAVSTKNYLSFNGTFGSAYMINSKSEKADACLKFLELFSTDQTLADLVCYGIEGKHYTRDAEGYVTAIPDSGYAGGGVWATCNVMAPSLMVGESADKKEQYAEYNENAVVDLADAFRFDDTNVAAEVAAAGAVYSEYYYLLENGFYDPDTYLEKFHKGLKDAGIDKIIAEMQAQYDTFLAEN